MINPVLIPGRDPTRLLHAAASAPVILTPGPNAACILEPGIAPVCCKRGKGR